MRIVTWLNIVTQITFPLAGAFTPALAGANREQHFLNTPAQTVQQTRVYVLSAGESLDSVAKKYNMSPDALRQLNQFRTVAHSLNNLQPGDELDVPAVPLNDKKNGAASETTGARDNADNDEQAQKVASVASQAGGVLANNPNGDAAAGMAQGMATGAASSEIQQWLNRFGTARVQLDANKNFSLKNSQFDLLVPLYDQGSNVFFSQGSIHRTDDRTQSNLGVGLRHFTSTYMVGGNLFGDYDISRDHARAGVGVEYWRDFLKLGVNNYMRLTGWKDSPDLKDYQERPANGWDVRAQAWLPSLPQLGGKLTFEQYYGEEVALFGVDNRQKNPHAITAGINYTPVPLITVSAEQRQGQSGENDTRFGVDMNYQLGVPWLQQVDPAAVAAMRSLSGSRYDLVERNNNIVLEYRKKDVIRLHTADLVTGHAGEQKSLGVSVTSTYGLARIDWSASSLLAAGGQIEQNGGGYSVVLPAYRSAAGSVNSYTVSGVAVDTQGNQSNRSETQVTVQAPTINKANSTFTPVSTSLTGDGKSTQVLTLTLKDENNQAVDMAVADITLNSGSPKSATVSAPTRKGAGIYEVTVTAGTDAETVTVTPEVNGVKLSSAGVIITSSTPVRANSSIAVNTTTYVSGSDIAATVTLKDVLGHPVMGAAASLTGSTVTVANATLKLGAKSGSSWKDNNDGTYTATYTADTAGTGLKATVKLSGWSADATSAAYAITAGVPAQVNSSIKTDTSTYVSGSDIAVTVTLKDTSNNPVTGVSAALTTTSVTVANATLKTGSSWKDNNDGTYTATYTADTAGTGLKATVKLSGWSADATSAVYSITERITLQDVSVNGYTFAKDAGFPTTGFTGAKFTLELSSGSASDFDWSSSDPSWMSVNNGEVRFTGTGTKNKVTITGTPKNGTGTPITYSFKLKSWYINTGVETKNWPDAHAYCTAQLGYSQPTRLQLADNNNQIRGKLDTLWGEWGDVTSFSTSGFSIGRGYWSASVNPADSQHVYVLIDEGTGYSYDDTFPRFVVCRQGF